MASGYFRTLPSMRAALVLLVVVPALAACAGGDDDDRAAPDRPPPAPTAPPPAGPTETATTTETAPPAESGDEPQAVTVYFVRDGKIAPAHRRIPPTPAVARAAVDALSRGPTPAERAAGLETAVAANTIVGSLSVENGTATITLQPCPPMEQVIFTLTQFSTVERVKSPCLADEAGVTRADLESLMPAILVESPAPGEAVRSPLRIRGSANTFEATFLAHVVDADGDVVAEQVVTATSGSGTRGTFRATIPFEVDSAGGKLVVFEQSAEDGEPVNTVEIPLRLQP